MCSLARAEWWAQWLHQSKTPCINTKSGPLASVDKCQPARGLFDFGTGGVPAGAAPVSPTLAKTLATPNMQYKPARSDTIASSLHNRLLLSMPSSSQQPLAAPLQLAQLVAWSLSCCLQSWRTSRCCKQILATTPSPSARQDDACEPNGCRSCMTAMIDLCVGGRVR